ncbi:hypothetical protein M0802_006848 [Mischocyttarus mexicanus]|nr:hypothetical protein M0802_006848 [Mischocyttarus mexicanus]
MSNKKGCRGGNVHPGRPKKRRYYGNRRKKQNDTELTSTSVKKLKKSTDIEEVPVISNSAYCILEFASVFSAISASVVCKKCKSDVSFAQSSSRGLGFKIIQSCKCDKQQLINSCPMIQNACEINRRFVFVMRLLGVGHEGVNLFCGLMDICGGIGNSTYYAILENIQIAASAVFHSVLTFPGTQEKTNNEEAGVIKILTTMGCSIGREAHAYVQKRDSARISRSQRRANSVKQNRIQTKSEQTALNCRNISFY